jgi:protease-4
MRRLLVLVVTVLASALLGCEGRRRASSADTSRGEPRSGPAIAVLDLSEGVPEESPVGFFGLPSKSGSLEDFVNQAELLGRDKQVRGVLVRVGAMRIGLARATEIGALLARLGAKLPVWCHADELANASLYLMARGCKRIWASPGGTVDAIGLAAQMVYFHKLLADELGLDVDFLQVGKYKGAEEPLTRDGPSPEALASLQSSLSDMRESWLAGIRTGRSKVDERVLEDGPYTSSGAKERGLIDDLGYFDEARTALQKEAHAARVEVRFGPASDAAGGDTIGDVLRVLSGESLGGAAPVVVVRAVGAISLEGGGLFGKASGIVERRLVPALLRVEKDDDIKAVVLRIDSPGGSALASDLIWHQLMRIRAKKPLVVSVGDMAASGGYYLASAGSVIFADDASIVGSIGVVGGKIAAQHALERIGVHAATVPAKVGDPHAAARAAYESLLTPWDEPTRQRLLETMTGIYDLFLARIAEGRNIPVERVAPSAEGRIFSGRDGKRRGLVDELGGLFDAIARARTMAGLPEDARVGVIGDSPGFLQTLMQDEPQGQSRALADQTPMTALAPELTPFLASVVPLAASERTLCSMPFALTVR